MNVRHKIVIRYKLGALSFYKEENGIETLCNSVSIPLPKFHIVLTAAAQKRNSLSVEITSLLLETSSANSITVKVSSAYVGRPGLRKLSVEQRRLQFHETFP